MCELTKKTDGFTVVGSCSLRSYQLQFSLPLLGYNTSGVEVYYR